MSLAKAQDATEELNYLMNCNHSISFDMAKMTQHFSDVVSDNMAQVTLSRRDAY